MKRFKLLIIWGAIILAVAGASVILAKSLNRQPQYELYEARKGAVAKTVSVSGSVVSREKLELSFLSPGIVKTVNVKVGDQVKAGDLLIALDDSLLKAQAAQSSAGLKAAQAMLSKAQNSLRSVDQTLLDQSLANANLTLQMAKHNLQDAYSSRDIEINNARVTLQNVESAYRDALNIYNATQGSINQALESAKVALSNALSALSWAQSNYNRILSLYNSGQATLLELQQAQMSLNSANSGYLTARANYDAAIRQVEAQRASALAGLHNAEAQLNSARSAYDAALTGSEIKLHSAENGVQSAQAAYNLALAQYNQASAPAHPADLDSAQAQVAANSAMLRSAQVQIERMRLKAPINGTVTLINAKTSELVGMSGPAIILETTDDFLIEANISETDVNQVQVGQPVKINFDALSQTTATGIVAKIDPAATVILGVINYKVTIALDSWVDNLRSSMTTDLEILTDSREDVLFLPRQALIRTNSGYNVKVLTADGPIEKSVEVGLIGDSEIEIISGLSLGDQVILKEVKP